MRVPSRTLPALRSCLQEPGGDLPEMCWGASTTFSSDQSPPTLGRQFCSEQLRDALAEVPGRDDLISDAKTVVSELITNAVRAGTSVTRLSLSLHRDLLRILVDDVAPGRPKLRRPEDDDADGRGLAIVAALSISWSTEDLIPGKRVWADLAVDPCLTIDLPSCVRPTCFRVQQALLVETPTPT